jgi:hypothetical protein
MEFKDGKVTRKSKGSKKYAVKKHLTFQHYKDVLQSGQVKLLEANGIRSYNHRVFTEVQTKVALSANDDKRYVKQDNIHTLAWGHYQIEEEMEVD